MSSVMLPFSLGLLIFCVCGCPGTGAEYLPTPRPAFFRRAVVGAMGLIGMMIKNGVVLLDEITLQIASGKGRLVALLDSSSSRFRPVMMASLTTILGMIPLLGDDLFGSLAVTIMGGLLVGTVITLVFIPVLYALFFPIEKEDKVGALHKSDNEQLANE